MTNSEFSDAFSTLLNSYNTQANFGEEASRQEIVLDEYEKSVLLTQAQDIIVKSYFDRTLNNQGQGFDDSTRRQVDFSSLITTSVLLRSSDQSSKFDDRGIIFDLPTKEVNGVVSTDVLFILNEKLKGIHHVNYVYSTVTINGKNLTFGIGSFSDSNLRFDIKFTNDEDEEPIIITEDNNIVITCKIAMSNGEYAIRDYWRHYLTTNLSHPFRDYMNYLIPIGAGETAWPSDSVDWSGYEPTTISLFANPNTIEARAQLKTTNYVVVPISYKEYDREMSKPYAQPLKKQAWRLFQNQSTGFDLKSELIPKWSIQEHTDALEYKIRYVKRPRPIILEDLPDGLNIDGISTESSCELNPILHLEILQKAVEIAVATRGAAPQRTQRENG